MIARTILSVVALLAAAVTAFAQPPAEPAKADPKGAPPTPPATQAQESFVYVQMTTSMGDVVLELNKEKAPISVDNFLKYVDEKFYDGTIFHRVIDNFMVQGGGFTPDLKQKATKKPIKNEWQNGLKNVKYSVAMARTAIPDSATSQFYINVKDNPFLDDGSRGAAYAVFGKVVSGFDVVDKMKAVKTGEKGGMKDVPVDTLEIKSVKKLSDEEAGKYKGGEKK